ncbi:MAG: type II secretion system protein [Bacilli bacterium]
MKKGFTLIEMLGIIAVLAVVLLVTFPVLNNSLKKMQEDKNKNFMNNLKISAEAYAGLNNIDTATQITVQDLYDASLLKGQYKGLDTSSKLSVSKAGIMAAAVKIEDKCYIKESDEDEIIVQDYNVGTCYYKRIISEEITIAGEPFLVIDSNRSETKLIAKYNLLIGNTCTALNSCTTIPTNTPGYGRQSSAAIGYNDKWPTYATVSFASSTYWTSGVGSTYPGSYIGPDYPYVYDSNSSLKTQIDNYKTLLNNNGGSVKEARLISYKEAEKLGCTKTKNSCPKWLSNTTFFTGNAKSNTTIYDIYKTPNRFSDSGYSTQSVDGLRPVIIVNTSDL